MTTPIDYGPAADRRKTLTASGFPCHVGVVESPAWSPRDNMVDQRWVLTEQAKHGE